MQPKRHSWLFNLASFDLLPQLELYMASSHTEFLKHAQDENMGQYTIETVNKLQRHISQSDQHYMQIMYGITYAIFIAPKVSPRPACLQ